MIFFLILQLDFREAPSEVKFAYKMYYKMKTNDLSKTLTDILDDDEDDEDYAIELESMNVSYLDQTGPLNDITPAINELLNPQITLPPIPKPTFIDDHNDKKISNPSEFEAAEQSTTNENAWNESLNKPKPREKLKPKETTFKKKLSLNIEPAMLKPLRNPKKSLSRSKTSIGNGSAWKSETGLDALPDLETILLEKSRSSVLSEVKPAVKTTEIKTSIDLGWLDRNSSTMEANTITATASTVSTSSSFGLSNLNIKASSSFSCAVLTDETKYHVDASDNEIVSNSEDDEPRVSFLHIAKKRRLSEVSYSNENLSKNDETREIIEAVPVKLSKVPEKPARHSVRKPKNVDNLHTIEEETFKPNVEEIPEKSEEEANESETDKTPPVLKRKRSVIKRSKDKIVKLSKKAAQLVTGSKKAAKEVEDEETKPEPEEEINFLIDSDLNAMTTVPRASQKDLKTTEKLFDNYLRQQEPLANATKTVKVVDAKTEAKKLALEKKVASGTLNENYVRVNLKKKVFVRGKKAFSFSKYKKGVWKSKKAAALSGPEMDMRGCDGGVLKCFNCDGIGHFAQNCKKKGDSLLPIDVDVKDESPFPTLEEAAQMASEQKLLVHYNKPDEIPSTSNEIWKELDETTDEETEDVNDKENKDGNSEAVEERAEVQAVPVSRHGFFYTKFVMTTFCLFILALHRS